MTLFLNHDQFKRENGCGIVVFCIWMVYLCMSTFESYVQAAMAYNISKYYLIFFVLTLFVYNPRIKLNIASLLALLWLMYSCVSVLWTSYAGWEQLQLYFFTINAMVLIFLLSCNIHFTEKGLMSLVLWYEIFSMSLGILGVFFTQELPMSMGTRSVLMLFGQQIDPNDLVALYGIGTGIALCDLFGQRKHLWISFITLSVNSYGILMSGSRSGLLLLIMQVLVACVFFEKARIKTWFYLLMIVGAGCLIGAFAIPAKILDRLLGRGDLVFFDGTGREDHWNDAMQVWMNSDLSIIFGCGWGAFEAHGTFFTMLIDGGLVGIGLFLSMLLWIGMRALKQRNLLSLMILVTGMIPAVFIGAQNRRYFWNAIIISLLLLLVKWRRDK